MLQHIPEFASISWSLWVFLGLALLLALGFEFVNGFHDTANAVATVIYTNTLPAGPAVVWSGIFNFLGVLTSSGAVAFSIVNLLPVELVIHVGSAAGFSMVFALLCSAILWNLGTWYLGLPASSSHTLIGSIMGVGISNALMSGKYFWGSGVNWANAKNVGLGLMISPLIGFFMAALLLIVMKILVKNPKLYSSPEGTHPPPGWIRALLMFTCTGVSFAHGSNDGQKGMGLIMLILIGILPSTFAIKSTSSEMELNGLRMELRHCISYCSTLDKGGNPSPEGKDPSITITRFLRKSAPPTPDLFAAVSALATRSDAVLEQANSLKQVAPEMRGNLRTDLYLLSSVTTKLANSHQLRSSADEKSAERFASCLNSVTNYIPLWVKIAVSLALGLGTMIGWKRIVVTVGEKIGKSHLSYGQGACAELVAMITIMAGDLLGLPISTTHVLSSGVAGTMAANGSGIQTKTLRNIIMAWVLTLPVCVFLGATLFALVLNLLIHLGFM